MSNTFLFGNLAGSTLAGAISSTATTINLASGTGALFPHPAAGQQFALRLISASDPSYTEIVYVTAVSIDALTVVRARESTAALSFNAGDFAKHVVTAAALTALSPQSILSGNGYIIFPGGFTIQWGQVTTSAGTASVTFPIAFTAVYQVVATDDGAVSWTSTNGTFCGVASPTATGFTARSLNWNGTTFVLSVALQSWIAVGKI